MDWDEQSELGGEPAAEPKSSDSSKDGEGKGKDKGSDDVAALRAQIDGLTRKQAELEAANRYWEQRLGAGSRAADPDDDGEEPEDEGEDDPADDGNAFDDFSKKGIEALVKRGVLTKKAAAELIEKQARRIVREVVTHETNKLRADGELYDKYPELKDLKSDHAKLTAQYFQEAIRKDRSAAKSSWALEMAAARAKAELEAKTAANRREEPEARRRRIAVQSPGGDAWGGGGDDLMDDGPSPAQLALAGKFGFSAEEARDIVAKDRKRR